jgi:hypothetical protein
MEKLMNMNPMWRATYFAKATDATIASWASSPRGQKMKPPKIAFDRMMDYERVDLVRTLDTTAKVSRGEYHRLGPA